MMEQFEKTETLISNTHAWVLGIIKSCTRLEQLHVCREMVGAFSRLYTAPVVPTMVTIMQNEIAKQQNVLRK